MNIAPFVRYLVALPLVVALVLFTIAHREAVEIVWSPFHAPIAMPLYLVVLVFLAIGFILGAFILWLGMLPVFSERRKYRKKVEALEKDLNESNEKLIAELSRQAEERKEKQNREDSRITVHSDGY